MDSGLPEITSRVESAIPTFRQGCSYCTRQSMEALQGGPRPTHIFGGWATMHLAHPIIGCGFAKQINDIVILVDNASKDLFGKTMAPHDCLHSLLPLKTEKKHDLRTRGHNHPLPQCKYNLHRNSFLVRSLFEYV